MSQWNIKESWKEDEAWMGTFWFLDAVVVLSFFVYVTMGASQLFITFRYSKVGGWTAWNAPSVSLIILSVGCLGRVVSFSGDPYAIREIYPTVFEEILFTAALLFFLNAAMILFLNLLEVMQQKGIERLHFLRKHKWTFIGFSFGTTMLAVAAGIWRVMSNLGEASLTVYNLSIGVATLTVAITSGAVAISSYRAIKHVSQIVKLSGTDIRSFLWKLVRSTAIISLACFFGTLAVLVSAAINGTSYRWSWLIFNFIFRMVEVVCVGAYFRLIWKRIPPSDLHTHSSQGGNTSLSKQASEEKHETEIEMKMENLKD